MTRIVLMSDPHFVSAIPIPDGDILIVSGDLTWLGREEELIDFNIWMGSLPHPVKLVTAGNHDKMFESDPARARALMTNVTYLEDQGIEVAGLKFWLSPWSPTFGTGWAFNADRWDPIKEKWNMIPSDTNVLVTHGPPFGYGDMTVRGERVGCEELIVQIQNRIKPALVVSGHIHGDYGVRSDGTTIFANASICNEAYQHVNAPIVIEVGP